MLHVKPETATIRSKDCLILIKCSKIYLHAGSLKGFPFYAYIARLSTDPLSNSLSIPSRALVHSSFRMWKIFFKLFNKAIELHEDGITFLSWIPIWFCQTNPSREREQYCSSNNWRLSSMTQTSLP